MKNLKVIYVYDAHCSWCYAFSKEMQRVYKKYKSELDFEVISGGMVIDEQVGELAKRFPPEQLLSIYERIENMTGVAFGKEYLAKVKTGNVYINSEIPAIALSIFKEEQPDRAVDFAHAIQEQLFVNAKAVNDDEMYKALAEQFDLDGVHFLQKMKEEKYQQAARYDFALGQQLQVTGYPQVLVQVDETQFYLIARGYTPFEALDKRLDTVIKNTSVKS